jgi:hypothetical protein
MKVRELLEGGWVSTVTQDVKLTPALAKRAVALLPKFEKAFNDYLEQHGLQPVKVGAPVGSTSYIERDLKHSPDKEYGDIDVLLKLPKIEGASDGHTAGTYKKALADFTHDAPDFIYPQEKPSGSNIILKVGDDWVQVDLVATPVELADWTQHRMTPEYNVKGALIGFLYAALAEVLHLSIGTSGVQAKEKGGQLVPFRQLKVDRTHTISTNIETFAHDILKFLATRAGKKDAKVDPQLKDRPGLVRGEIKIDHLIQAVRGLGRSLEANGLLGKGALGHISDADDFIEQVKDSYRQKAEKLVSSSKFDKAATPAAKKKAQDTKDLLRTQSEKILARL